MKNYYKPGECITRQMTPEEMEADRKEQTARRRKFPWRYKGAQAEHDCNDYCIEQKYLSVTGKRRKSK